MADSLESSPAGARVMRMAANGVWGLLGMALVVTSAAADPPAPPGANPSGLFGPAINPVDRQFDRLGGQPLGRDAVPERTGTPSSLDLFQRPSPSSPPVGRTWTISPSIGVQGVATDNFRNSTTRRESSVYTVIAPGVVVSADTSSLRGSLSYQPTVRLHAGSSDQNRVDQQFSGRALATVLPELLFVDVRGFGAVRPVSGGVAPESTQTISREDRVQSTSYQVSPYLLQRFGGLATLQVGYAYRQTSDTGRSAFLPGQSQPFFTNQDTTSNEGFAVLRSGEDWGRFAFEARSVNTQFDGSGIYNGAHRYVQTLQTRYSLTREVALLGEGGYEDQRFNGVTPLVIQEPIWNVGIRVSPDDDSYLTVRYGQREGFESISVNGAASLTPLTRVFVAYSERLSTTTQNGSDLIDTLVVDSFGNLVDSVTGAPALLAFGNSLAAVQVSQFRVKRSAASINQTFPRDRLTLAVQRVEREPVAVAPGTFAFAQTTNSVSLAWSRNLSEVTTAFAFGQYGQSQSAIAGDGDNFTLQFTLATRLTESMSATLQYLYTNRGNDAQADRTIQNAVIVGLRQFF